MSKKGKTSKRNLIEQELDDAVEVEDLGNDDYGHILVPYLHGGNVLRSDEKIKHRAKKRKIIVVKMEDTWKP